MSRDPYFKKVISFDQSGHSLNFRVSQDLFSSFDVDVGTRFLLRTVAGNGTDAFHRILDLGCGYGPVGLTMQKLTESSIVHMVDRDALAVEYSRRNTELNGASGVNVYGSLGYDDVTRKDFDLIVSNIPAKAGEPAISYFLRDAVHYLAPGGLVAVVVISRLEPVVAQILGAMPNAVVVLRRTRSGHAVFHYRFLDGREEPRVDGRNALERGIYHRGMATMSFGELTFSVQTAYGLPEFDSPSHSTELLVDGIFGVARSDARRVVVFNPGQGQVPVAVWKIFGPDTMDLVDRDLLALRYSRHNLMLHGRLGEQVSVSHQVGMSSASEEQADLVVGVLREDEGPAAVALTIDQAAERLSPGGVVLVSGSSTAVSRLVAHLRSQKLLKVEDRRRRGGNSLLALKTNR